MKAKQQPPIDGIFLLLEEDHREMQSLFDQMRKEKSARKRAELFTHLRMLFYSHAAAEENAVYAQLEADTLSDEEADWAHRDHDSMRLKLELLRDLDCTEESWLGQIKEIEQALTQHISQEEDGLFPLMRRVFNRNQLQEMKTDFLKSKSELKFDAA